MENNNSFFARVRKTLLWGLPVLLMIGIIVSIFFNIFIYNAKQVGWEELQDYQGRGITSQIFIDDEDRAWFGYSGNGVGMWDGEKTTIYTTSNSGIVDDRVNAIFVDTEDNLWVGTEAGLSVFDGKEWVTYTATNSGLASDIVISIAVDPKGQAWIGTDNGVSILAGDEWTTYTTSNSEILDDEVRIIAIDQEGKVWIGTQIGVSVFSSGKWTNFTPENSGLIERKYGDIRYRRIISDIVFDQEGRAWIGVWGAGINVYDGKNWMSFTNESPRLICDDSNEIANGPDRNRCDLIIRGITIDPDGNVWFGTYDRGVSVWDGAIWTTYTYENSGLNDYGVYDLAAFSTGEILIATSQGPSPWVFSNLGQQPVSPSLIFVYNFLNNQYSYFCILPLSIILWLAIVYSMLKRGEIEYGRYLGKSPNFKIGTDKFIEGLPKFRVAMGYIGLGIIGAVLALLGFYSYCSAFYCGDEWGLALMFFSIPALVAGAVYSFITGGISRKWWAAFLGGIVGGVVGFLYFSVDEAVVWLGMVIGAPLGLVLGKRNRVWATLLGGIIGFTIAILCGVIFGW